MRLRRHAGRGDADGRDRLDRRVRERVPQQSVELFDMCAAERWPEAIDRYMAFLPLLRWDADPRFVQAIKIAQEEAGVYGGPVRLPRLALPAAEADEVRAAVRQYLAVA